MSWASKLAKPYRVDDGKKIRLKDFDPSDTGDIRSKEHATELLETGIAHMAELQNKLYAQDRWGVLLILQAMDAAGKDGTVKHVMSGVNPSGCEVVPFKVPTEEEAAHDFLWRAHRAAPRRGHITIFNRSHYEDVLVPRVHRTVPRAVVRRRYAQINDFERILADNGTLIVKFFLHISRREQRRRLAERLADPDKAWKFSVGDLKERALWERYVTAYEKLLSRCSTPHAPWYVIPADRKWHRNLAVASVLVHALEDLGSRYPPPALSPAQARRLRAALAAG